MGPPALGISVLLDERLVHHGQLEIQLHRKMNQKK